MFDKSNILLIAVKLWQAYFAIDSSFLPPVNSENSIQEQSSPSQCYPGAVQPCPLKKGSSGVISKKCFREIFDKNPDKDGNVDQYYDAFMSSMDKYNIKSKEEKALFLGQVAHETGNLNQLSEKKGYSTVMYDGERYDYKDKEVNEDGTVTLMVRKRKGTTNSINPLNIDSKQHFEEINVEAEELSDEKEYFDYLKSGELYIGRGGMHLTHLSNYKSYFQKLSDEGKQLDYQNIEDLKSLNKPDLAADSAGWFWRQNVIKSPNVNDIKVNNDSIEKVTKIVNGGTSTVEERKNKTLKILDIMNKPECSVSDDEI